MSQICRNRPKMGPVRTVGRARKPAFIPRLTALEGRTLLAATLVVKAARVLSPPFRRRSMPPIAAGGDTIQINPGTYTEQGHDRQEPDDDGRIRPRASSSSPSTTLTPDSGLNSGGGDQECCGRHRQRRRDHPGSRPDGHHHRRRHPGRRWATANVINSTIAHIRSEPLNNNSGTGYVASWSAT